MSRACFTAGSGKSLSPQTNRFRFSSTATLADTSSPDAANAIPAWQMDIPRYSDESGEKRALPKHGQASTAWTIEIIPEALDIFVGADHPSAVCASSARRRRFQTIRYRSRYDSRFLSRLETEAVSQERPGFACHARRRQGWFLPTQ